MKTKARFGHGGARTRFGLIARVAFAAVLMALSSGLAPTAWAGERFITVASTTSTQNSGLFGFILPKFQAKTGIAVHVVAVGTGQAIKIAERGDADVLLVHHRASEEKFIAEGYGVKRFNVMYNDFVVIGPKTDPAAISGMTDVVAALKKIAKTGALFASRGDDSGTNKKEMDLWKIVGINPQKTGGKWYRETGSGMGATLNTAAGLGAYTLSDRATWIDFGNKGDMKILVQGDPRLFNQYGIMLVNPLKHPTVKVADGQAFIDWMLSKEGQKTIADYHVAGQQLFHPNASSNTP